jgi:DNA primase
MGRGETVVLCEGPETGLSLRECTGLPVAVALGAGLLFQAEFGPEVRRVVVAADLGAPGLDAAERAAAALRARGIDVRLALPPEAAGKKADFNDVHVRLGADAVRAAVLGA